MSSLIKDLTADEAKKNFTLIETGAGEFSEIRKNGMRFLIRTYEAEGFGKLFVMDMKAMFGLMRMETVTFTPVKTDGPILSMDVVKAFGRATLVLELYDTTLSHPAFDPLAAVKQKYALLPSYDPGDHPYYRFRMPQSDYKRGRGITKEVLAMADGYLKAYFGELKKCAPVDSEVKSAKNREFSGCLFECGGPAVNQFKKMIGEEKTKKFLLEYMY